jgi:hypothetical protein
MNLQDRIFTIGSCFAEVIGNSLAESKFKVLVNPFGAVYNPWSIHKLLRYVIRHMDVPPETYVKNQGIEFNFDFHSCISSLSMHDLKSIISERIGTAHNFLKNTKWLFLTYGTSFVYERSDSGEIVANCHKMPASNFKKYLLSQKKILEDFQLLHEELTAFNPDIQIILTLSPVRHLKDTVVLNSVSKSILRLTCHTLQETYSNTHYFPAYEIMLDDLRDYRFYKPDMIHPNEVAEEYIWERFAETLFDKSTSEFVGKWKSISAALKHKSFHPTSEGHQQFLRETLTKLNAISSTVNVDKEINMIKNQIMGNDK